ncbi:hypothetical protein CC86DRAFT_370617 [Ophiobolus disseminans]|uniref:C2H2-type domain-containing protein n=1 Tax=Ophiobolus disseminans TaxID=1469910 RepID=A0A6A6ZYT3_9PLEO|nr:hypothetical protein CC86DRAFT_370617 [Ophiobolus disseminans]
MAVRCYRCDRSFRTYNALYQHQRDSRNHNECPECDFDGISWDDLLEHCRDEGCQIVCEGCNDGGGSHWDNDGVNYQDHIETENVCTECDQHFGSLSNLYQHKLSHRAKTYECYQCDRTFKTYGGMIIHLERGTCSNTSEIYLNELAAECHKWRHFVDEDFQGDMYNARDLSRLYNNPHPYMCPTCDAKMTKLSSLFQHIESSSCSQTLNDGIIGQLRNYLASRL